MRGNVIDLAVAFVVGAAFTALVKSLVDNLITPLVTAIFGKSDYSYLYFTVNGSKFTYGTVINGLLSFLSIAAAVYFVIVAPLNRLNEIRKARAGIVDENTETETELLAEIRDLLRDREHQPSLICHNRRP